MSEFFRDDVGDLSCMRLMCVVVLLTILVMWVWGMLMVGAYVPMGYGEAGLLGAALGGKAVQSRFEYGGPGI